MASKQSTDLASRANAIYEQKLKSRLESTNLDDFVAIEPESEDFFLGKTLSEAIQAARTAHPARLPFALRVGHTSTVELGVDDSMNGEVDDSGRALIVLPMRPSVDADATPVAAWVDTAFTGDLVIPRGTIERLGLRQSAAVMAGLADGTRVVLETYSCMVQWFGQERVVEVVGNDGEFPGSIAVS